MTTHDVYEWILEIKSTLNRLEIKPCLQKYMANIELEFKYQEKNIEIINGEMKNGL